jgi:hypothetical protein
MDIREREPAWWQLYLLLALMIALLVIDGFVRISESDREAAALGALVLLCMLGALWVRANRKALLYGYRQESVHDSASGGWPLAYPLPVMPPEVGAGSARSGGGRSDREIDSSVASPGVKEE